MQRQSPPTDRVVRVLNLMAAHPRDRFTLTQLTQRLSITKATCLGIVGALVREGYLRRDPLSKSYGLGPALLPLGRAARESFASLELARPLLNDLTERFGNSCTASTVIGNDIVVLERTRAPGELANAVQPGQRYPYAPPSGVVFAVWQSDKAMDRWLSAYPPVPIDVKRLRVLAASSRRLGYLVERLTDISVSSYTLLAGLTASNAPDAVVRAFNEIVAAFPDRYYLASDLLGPDPIPVSVIMTPTYTEVGTPDLLLGMFVLADVGPSEIATMGRAVSDVAQRVTRHGGGVNPWAGALVERDSGIAG